MLFTIGGGILGTILACASGKIISNAIEANNIKKGIINHIEKIKTEKQTKELES